MKLNILFRKITFISALLSGALHHSYVLAASSCSSNQVSANGSNGSPAFNLGLGSTIGCVDISGGLVTNLGTNFSAGNGLLVLGTITNNLEISSPFVFQSSTYANGLHINSSGNVGTILIGSSGSIQFNQSGTNLALTAITSEGTIGSIDNYGVIGGLSSGASVSSFLTGIYLNNSATVGNIYNRSGATIYGLGRSAIDVDGGSVNHPVVTTINNSGSIIGGTSAGSADSFAPYSTTAGAITNTAGVIGSESSGTGIINNAGGVITGGQYASGISNRTFQGWNTPGGTIYTILNNGTISTTSTTATYAGISNYGSTINTITNNGTISSASGYGIKNTGVIMGVIGTLNNAQGAGNASGALTYTGGLPTNYNVIINSTTNYGRLSATSISGSLTFGIYSGSTITTGVYSQIFTGLSAGNIAGSLTGTFTGGYSYSLALQAAQTSIWDLTITKPTASVTSGSTTTLSSVSDATTISVAGGTLQANTANSTITSAIQLTGANTTTIDASGNSTKFTGAVTTTGTAPLSISSSTAGGMITLNAVGNSIAGGVSIASGTLAIGDIASPTASITADVAISASSTLQGHGTITGAVTNTGGTVKPGGSIGTLTINGNYTSNSSSTLEIELDPATTSLLQVNGVATIAGGLRLVANNGVYTAKKYTIVNATGGLSGSFSTVSSDFSKYTSRAYNISYDTNNVYLNLLNFTLVDTQNSINAIGSGIQGAFTLQSANLINGMTYDCPIFDKNNVCVSVGGRGTTVNSDSYQNTASVLIGAYQIASNLRIGTYLDQNLSSYSSSSVVKLGNATPMIGLFGIWSEHYDGLGAEIKVSVGYGEKSATLQRPVYGDTEPGTGSSKLYTKGAQIIAKYGFSFSDSSIFSPYSGIRYTTNSLNSYSEQLSNSVTVPLSYSAMNRSFTTLVAGLGLLHRYSPKTTFIVSAGLETDLSTSGGVITASGVAELNAVNLNSNLTKTRPTAMAGVYYDIEKNQRIGINGIYRQEPYNSLATTSVMATYTIGL